LRTIVQTFFIEVQLLILDTKDCQHLRLVDFTVRLTAPCFGQDDMEIFIARQHTDARY